jgi:hypothetical protein
MSRGVRVNASDEQAGREFGPDGQGVRPAGEYFGSASHLIGGFRFTPPNPPQAIGEGDDREAQPAREIFGASVRRPLRPAGAPNPEIRTRLKVASDDQGPCLYFGPSGERCHRRALRDGFCAAHLPATPSQLAATDATAGPTAEKPYRRTVKIVSALIALLGFLAPLLDNIVREILRWLHSH